MDDFRGVELGRPPLMQNVAHFAKPQDYAVALRHAQELRQRGHRNMSCGPRERPSMRSPIDEAISREFIGEGMALQELVDARRRPGWAVKQRHLQKSDVGHCCYGCRKPLRDMREEVTVWTGAAIYRRFHPACAATYILRCDSQPQSVGSADVGGVADRYADGWREPRSDTMAGGRSRQAVEAARQWLLSQDPSSFGALRGDLFTTVTVVENGQKKAVPGLTHDQLRLLQTAHKYSPLEDEGDRERERPVQVECAICFASVDKRGPLCVRLPCSPHHVFHVDCVLPWLKKASLCPTCRTDLRPMLRGVAPHHRSSASSR